MLNITFTTKEIYRSSSKIDHVFLVKLLLIEVHVWYWYLMFFLRIQQLLLMTKCGCCSWLCRDTFSWQYLLLQFFRLKTAVIYTWNSLANVYFVVVAKCGCCSWLWSHFCTCTVESVSGMVKISLCTFHLLFCSNIWMSSNVDGSLLILTFSFNAL